jgi:hypothetical protein
MRDGLSRPSRRPGKAVLQRIFLAELIVKLKRLIRVFAMR